MPEELKPKPVTPADSEEAEKLAEDIVTVTSASGDTSVVVYRHYCKGCEICAEVCPQGVLKMVITPDRWEGAMVEVVNIEACNACMLCEHQCPDFAIEVYSLKKEKKAKEKKEVVSA